MVLACIIAWSLNARHHDGVTIVPVEIPERLVELIRTGQCVLFLGAGATRDAGGPTGPELASLLAAEFSVTDIPTTDLQRFSDILMGVDAVDREDVDRVVVETLKSKPKGLCSGLSRLANYVTSKRCNHANDFV